ncbi:MAG TPA: UDP-glucose 4-epimerase GalE [Caulobacteraceae bacterium]
MTVRSRGTVLVTGGAGYIGAHTAKALHEGGWRPVVYDNLSAGYREAVLWGEFVHGDVRDARRLRETMEHHDARAVIHFASLIEVGRSCERPDLFYDVNVGGTAAILQAMQDAGVPRLVFSSTAAVYGQPEGLKTGEALVESLPKEPTNPYGDTKLACERMIAAHCRAFGLTAVALRYFNACGADASGLIGEAHDPETHLIPLTIRATLGQGEPLTVFGTDYDTPDGACLRDYIHVTDLAAAHVAALEVELAVGQFEAVNVGTGSGYSVLEVLQAVERVLGAPVPHAVGPRRAGDPATLIADPSRAMRLLSWKPVTSSLDRIVETAAAWHRAQRYGGKTAGASTQPETGTQANKVLVS